MKKQKRTGAITIGVLIAIAAIGIFASILGNQRASQGRGLIHRLSQRPIAQRIQHRQAVRKTARTMRHAPVVILPAAPAKELPKAKAKPASKIKYGI